MTHAEKPLPCPLCGKKPKVRDAGAPFPASIECGSANHSVIVEARNWARAIAIWNRRAK